ncbi:unnamed protein product [Soboliphyme baturini]|uniref:SERPIN domain-containing protein n=1 Tax=Soboliphyme baturini TaxID=241478 RepID=A0A183IPI9_9BILA|nr:unnamed protein product [Soboliphyme baturini]
MASEIAGLVANFGLQLYRSCQESGVSVVFSPLSIFIAMSMSYLGSCGETEAEMQQILYGGKLDKKRLLSYVADLMKSLHFEQENVVLRSANRMYCSEGYSILDSFNELLKKHFRSDMITLNFNDHNAASLVNSWILNQTGGKITGLLRPEVLSGSTKLLLVNALYFKGNWLQQFEAKNTSVENFYVDSQTTVKVSMMHRKGKFEYGERMDCQILSASYVGDFLKFFVILPKRKFALQEVENKLTGEELVEMFYNVMEAEVDVKLPKFIIEKSMSLKDSLKQLGLNSMFSYDTANFSDISEAKGLFVSAVEHKTFIEINEEGSEAASATAVVMRFRCSPSSMNQELSFFADHPFLFAVVDSRTMSMMFLGRYSGAGPSVSASKIEL